MSFLYLSVAPSGGDPGGNFRIQDIQRQRSVSQDFVVEGAQVELVSEQPSSFFSQFQNFQLSELVGQSLCGPRDVPVYLALDVGLVHGGVAVELGPPI